MSESAIIAAWAYAGMAILVLSLFLIERKFADAVARFEENVLAFLLTALTLLSFVQVVLRYGFNSGIDGALELTSIMFAWFILFGMSYGIRTNIHLGVDVLIRLLPKKTFRYVALVGAVCTVLYAVILISADWLFIFGSETRGGAVTYWSKMFQIDLGLEDVKYPTWFYEPLGLDQRVKRWIAYLILPIGLSLLAYRSVQATIAIFNGTRELIIASHEAEELVAENKDILKD
ncbi:MAG: TRAP transporter small permease [Devosiaceae bacterium]|nr:TRAP transporter small permease [Devosiaceae bacterium]